MRLISDVTALHSATRHFGGDDIALRPLSIPFRRDFTAFAYVFEMGP
jgi:hypothetical protein